MTLYRALYVSRSCLTSNETDAFNTMLAAAAERNARQAVTGVLAAANGAFLQVVEGRQELILRLLAAIARDPRHEAMTIIDARPAQWRLYPQWSMAGLRLDSQAGHDFTFEVLCERSAKQLYALLTRLQPVEAARLDAPIEIADDLLL